MDKSDKNRINEIKSIITKGKERKLKTTIDGKEFTLDDAEILVEDMINEKKFKSGAKKRYNNTVDDVNTIIKSKTTKK